MPNLQAWDCYGLRQQKVWREHVAEHSPAITCNNEQATASTGGGEIVDPTRRPSEDSDLLNPAAQAIIAAIDRYRKYTGRSKSCTVCGRRRASAVPVIKTVPRHVARAANALRRCLERRPAAAAKRRQDLLQRDQANFTEPRPFQPQILRTNASPRLRYMRVYCGPFGEQYLNRADSATYPAESCSETDGRTDSERPTDTGSRSSVAATSESRESRQSLENPASVQSDTDACSCTLSYVEEDESAGESVSDETGEDEQSTCSEMNRVNESSEHSTNTAESNPSSRYSRSTCSGVERVPPHDTYVNKRPLHSRERAHPSAPPYIPPLSLSPDSLQNTEHHSTPREQFSRHPHDHADQQCEGQQSDEHVQQQANSRPTTLRSSTPGQTAAMIRDRISSKDSAYNGGCSSGSGVVTPRMHRSASSRRQTHPTSIRGQSSREKTHLQTRCIAFLTDLTTCIVNENAAKLTRSRYARLLAINIEKYAQIYDVEDMITEAKNLLVDLEIIDEDDCLLEEVVWDIEHRRHVTNSPRKSRSKSKKSDRKKNRLSADVKESRARKERKATRASNHPSETPQQETTIHITDSDDPHNNFHLDDNNENSRAEKRGSECHGKETRVPEHRSNVSILSYVKEMTASDDTDNHSGGSIDHAAAVHQADKEMGRDDSTSSLETHRDEFRHREVRDDSRNNSPKYDHDRRSKTLLKYKHATHEVTTHTRSTDNEKQASTSPGESVMWVEEQNIVEDDSTIDLITDLDLEDSIVTTVLRCVGKHRHSSMKTQPTARKHGDNANTDNAKL